ncbi:MAG: aldehyde dehydrogenase family protein [Oligoflexia bacterium]|nr:aldehyde dehydrogenase family protein [Oligoflexia bacterium]
MITSRKNYLLILITLFIQLTFFNINSIFASDEKFNELIEKYKASITKLREDKSSEGQSRLIAQQKVLNLFQNIQDKKTIQEFQDNLKAKGQVSATFNLDQLTKVIKIPLAFKLVQLSDRDSSDSKEPLPDYDEIIQKFDQLRGLSQSKKKKVQAKIQAAEAKTTTEKEVLAVERVPTVKKETRGLHQIADTTFFTDLADTIESNKADFMKILTKLDNYPGAQYEITQVLKTLRGVKAHEWPYLQQIEGMNNIAIYGSRNIPLYTTIMHALIPAVAVKNVWFRTPDKSREIYIELFEKIKSLMPKYDLSNVHLLTEKKDVIYEAFQDKYILGFNSKGIKFDKDRNPADAVIFIGSPDTANKIMSEIESRLKSNKDLKQFKQIFLKFGSGLNPVIVTEQAKNQLDRAVEGVIDALRINNSQDCIAPKFYAVHDTMYEDFVAKLMKSVKSLRFGEQDSAHSDYSKLSFTEDFKSLIAFRDKYKDYLLNKDAKIDEAKKIVDPHVFSFPFSMFKNEDDKKEDDKKKVELVELGDHYAPFVILFKYDNGKEEENADSKEPASLKTIKKIANDERVRGRAMYASLYGDSSSTDMWKLRKQFEDNFHSTVVNMSVYDEESGNFPFGGYGGTASSVKFIHKEEKGEIVSTTSDRPLLFSKEAARFFTKGKPEPEISRGRFKSDSFKEKLSERGGLLQVSRTSERDFDAENVLLKRPQSEKTNTEKVGVGVRVDVLEPEMKSDPKYVSITKKVIKDALDLSKQKNISSNWKMLIQPQREVRAHGLDAIRKVIKKDGLTFVVNCKWFHITHEEIEKMYGGKVICWDEDWKLGTKFTTIKGVALHNAGIGAEISSLNKFRGEINPHLGYGMLPTMLEDRTIEFQTTESIWPHIMPRSITYDELIEKDIIKEEIEELRIKIQKTLLAKQIDNETKKALRSDLKLLVENTLNSIQKYYPAGAFAKNYNESTTGDLGNQIKTFHFNSDNIVDQYMNDVFSQNSDGFTFYHTGTKFINKLINDPDDILFQERVKIAQSDLGFNREIRVDYMDGEPVSARGRYSHEYSREDEEEAMIVLKKFFERAPEEFQHLSGGADLAKLEDGRWVIIEFNTGANSGSVIPFIFPIETNKFVSKLQEKNTPFIEELETVFKSSIKEQRAYLKSYTTEEERWQKFSLKDISQAEIGKYFRDRYLDEWRKDPTMKNADETLVKIKALFDGMGTKYNRDFPLLVRGAENYLNAKKEQM